MDADSLSALRTRIDQHLKFFDALERIRWQFTQTFGGGAAGAIALVVAIGDSVSVRKQVILLVLVLGLSVAGLVTQIRI